MSIITPTMPSGGSPRGGEELDLQNAVQALLTDYAGNVDENNLKDALCAILGVTRGSTVRRGSVVNAAAEAMPTTFGASMPTPDRITGLVVPAGGLVVMRYSARFTATAIHASNFFARASVWLGGSQITTLVNSLYAGQTLDLSAGSTGTWSGAAGTISSPHSPSISGPLGLLGGYSASALSGSPAIGNMAGTWLPLDVSTPGTHTLEVKWQLLTAGGSAGTVQERRLQAYVWAP